MDNLVIFYCPSCKHTFSGPQGEAKNCPTCLMPMHETSIFRDDWRKLSDEEKAKEKQGIEAFLEEQKRLEEEAAERERLESLVRARRISNMTTTADLKEEYEILGNVYGTNIYLVGGLIGGGLATQENLFSFAFEKAKEHMVERAAELKADAIVGMQTNVTSPGNLNYIIVTLTGTAVKLKK